jgi:hypothetical protein
MGRNYLAGRAGEVADAILVAHCLLDIVADRAQEVCGSSSSSC